MSLAPDNDAPAVAAEAPAAAGKRDLLGNACFYLHFAVLIYIVSGWALPVHALLYIYLAFLPLVILSWQFNKDSCVLNNLESWLRYGTWRSEHNSEEGAWLQTLIRDVTAIHLKEWQVTLLTYSVMAGLWFAGLSHLYWW